MTSPAVKGPVGKGLLVDGQWVATLEIADGFWSRLTGLMARSSFDGALLIRAGRPVRSIHTFGMRFPIDVAFCTDDLRVTEVCTRQPNRGSVVAQDRSVTQVIEAAVGSFAQWGIVPDINLEVWL